MEQDWGIDLTRILASLGGTDFPWPSEALLGVAVEFSAFTSGLDFQQVRTFFGTRL